jgi:hypothetical protein
VQIRRVILGLYVDYLHGIYTVEGIDPYFGTAEPNDIRYKGDIVKHYIKIARTEGISLLPQDIVITKIVISRFYCI